jgi:DNA-binding NarL/FixJ family response regulator
MKILIVDDELLLAMDLHDALRRAGYDVVGFAPTPEAARTMAHALRPALALVDINLLGDSEGIELGRALKDVYGADIIFITTYRDEGIIARAREIEPIAIMHKPVDQTELFRQIEQASRMVSA